MDIKRDCPKCFSDNTISVTKEDDKKVIVCLNCKYGLSYDPTIKTDER